MASFENINLTAADGQKISANFYPVAVAKGWLLMTHMMPATKGSWNSFAEEMQESGYAGLAIDLRGHGESQGGPDGFRSFSDQEHQESILDLECAWNFLKSRGAVPAKTTLIGASIGANLSLQLLADNPDITRGVLLSAGLDYRGVRTEAVAKKLNSVQSVLLVTSRDDGGNAAENELLYKALPEKMNKQLVIFENGGHGNSMFSAPDEPNLTDIIKKFLEHGSDN